MERNDLFQEHGFGAGDIFNGLTRHRLGHKADEVTGMTRLHGNPDFTISLEAADTRPMSGARIHDDEWPASWIDLHTLRWDNAYQQVVDRSLERPAVHHQLGRIIKDMRNRLGEMVAILVSTLAHHIQEQHAALGGICHVFKDRTERAEGGAACYLPVVIWHFSAPFFSFLWLLSSYSCGAAYH